MPSKKNNVAHPFVIGQNYFIRTVTMYWVGKLVDATDKELVLDCASWVAWTKRFSETVSNGTVDEAEFVGNGVIIGRGSIVDAFVWTHDVPVKTQ